MFYSLFYIFYFLYTFGPELLQIKSFEEDKNVCTK